MYITQPSFTGGEVSPSVQARVDLAKYGTSAKTMLNFFCHAHGGVSNRNGTYFVGELEDSSKLGGLIPFVRSKTEAYVLAFNDYTLRFIREVDGVIGYVTLALVASGTYKWTPSTAIGAVNEYYMELDAGGDPSILETFNVIENGTAMTEGTLGSLSAGQFAWGDNDTLGYSTVYVRLTDSVDPDTKADNYLYNIIEIATPYGEADLSELSVSQSEDTKSLYIAHSDYYPRKLTYTSGTSWSIAEAPFVDGPYRAVTADDALVSIVVTGRAGDMIGVRASSAIFETKHIGSVLRVGATNPADATEVQWGYGTIEGFAVFLVDNGTYELVTSGLEKYVRVYGGGNPGFTKPSAVYEWGYKEMTEGTVGSLSAGQWGWGDNNSLGYNTIYLYLSTPVITPVDYFDGYVFAVMDSISSPCDTVAVTPIKPFKYEQIVNPRFELGLLAWDLDATDIGAITMRNGYAAVLDFTWVSTKIMCQAFTVEPRVRYNLSVTINSVDNLVAGYLQVYVGTTFGSVNLLAAKNLTGAGTYDFYFTPGTGIEAAYITIGGAYTDSGEIWYIEEVSVTKADNSCSDFRIGAWNATDGYPKVVGSHEQRLIFGNTEAYPLHTWFSKTGNPEDFGFDTPTLASDAFITKLRSGGTAYPIQWYVSLNNLIAGTTGNEYRIEGEGGLALDSIAANPQSYNGSDNSTPLVIGNEVLYVEYGGSSVKDLSYSLEVDGYSGKNLSIMAAHLLEEYGITEWAYAKSPYSIIWAVRSDGTLLGFTYVKEHEVWGWHRHETEGDFESVCTIPSSSGKDLVFTIVERTINSATKRFIEVFKTPRITDGDTGDYIFMDCAVTYDGVAATTITGLDHLEGEDVAVLADGVVVTGKTVSSGQITLDTAASLVHVGLAYTSDLELLPVYIQDQNYGSSKSRSISIPSVSIEFKDSRSCQVGMDSSHLDSVQFRDDVTGEEPTTLFTGERSVSLDSSYEKDGRLFIRNSNPVPLTVLSVTPDVKISNKEVSETW
jgi:hypothetical protein